MTKKQKEEVALFRFGVICDLVGTLRLEHGDAEKLIQSKSEQVWNIPYSNRTRIAASTIRNWIKRYQKSDGQFSSLYPSGRSDQGRSRKVDDETILAIVKMKREKPSLPAADLIKELQKKELITPGIILYPSTVYRILQKEGVKRETAGKIDRRRFEAEYPNDIWQSDVMHGPMVEVDGKMKKSYLIAFIDDHSRLLPQAEFYLNERLVSWLDAFRKALLTRGLPRRLYVDNGSAFRTKHLERICASLGMALIHTPPYKPQGRGKIERFFRSIRDRFLPICPENLTLNDINRMFSEWIPLNYHNRIHTSTGETPIQRFGRHIELTRTAPVDLEDHFRKEVRRRVTKDRTVSINNLIYEAPTKFIGEQLQLLYHEDRPDRVEIIYKGANHGFLVPLDLNANFKVKRERDKTETEKSPANGKLTFSKGASK
ncbi:MAG: DDE-type integrase/transposase/recombinase [Deltaproteobacteria bacterium]|nr:DDE-type integrase/transposase/recombinase [Deltaproteobacteria bacterium]